MTHIDKDALLRRLDAEIPLLEGLSVYELWGLVIGTINSMEPVSDGQKGERR